MLLEQTASQRFSDLENSLECLGESYRASLARAQVLEMDNAELRARIAQRTKAVIVLSGLVILLGGFFITLKIRG